VNSPIPRTVGIVANVGKPEALDHVRALAGLLESCRVGTVLDRETAGLIGQAGAGRPLPELGRLADMIIVLGGDGTILRVARELEQAAPPVLGVNIGGLGFLTGVPLTELRATIEEILRGEYRLSERQRLQAGLVRAGQRLGAHHALNDAVISRSEFSRIVRLRVMIDGELLTEYVCDGMIFSTATGSTAYSLSAGGPILLPTAEAFILTPICPHALSNRSVIVGKDSVLECRAVSAAGDLILTVDGQVQVRMQVGDAVEVRRSPRTLQLVAPRQHSYFELLRRKLKWSGANV
jgi:NAD+ kinase